MAIGQQARLPDSKAESYCSKRQRDSLQFPSPFICPLFIVRAHFPAESPMLSLDFWVASGEPHAPSVAPSVLQPSSPWSFLSGGQCSPSRPSSPFPVSLPRGLALAPCGHRCRPPSSLVSRGHQSKAGQSSYTCHWSQTEGKSYLKMLPLPFCHLGWPELSLRSTGTPPAGPSLASLWMGRERKHNQQAG